MNKCDTEDTSSLRKGYGKDVKQFTRNSAKVNNILNLSAEAHKYTDKDISSLWILKHVIDIKDLLLHSADENKCNDKDVSPLWIAGELGHVKRVTELELQYSIEVNKCDDRGVSSLCIAIQAGHVLVIVELLLHLADVNKCNG